MNNKIKYNYSWFTFFQRNKFIILRLCTQKLRIAFTSIEIFSFHFYQDIYFQI